MNSPTTRLTVQVLGPDRQPVRDAVVVVRTIAGEVALSAVDDKGRYADDVRVGPGTITVERAPFEPETRQVLLQHDGDPELFHLRRAGQPFYYRGKVKVPFQPDDDRLALVIRTRPLDPGSGPRKTKKRATKDPAPASPQDRIAAAEALAAAHGLRMEDTPAAIREQGIQLCSFPPRTAKKRRREILDELARHETHLALPIVNVDERSVVLLTNEILARFDEHVPRDEVEQVAGELGLRVRRRMSALGNLYHLTTDGTPTYDILDTINRLAERDDVEFAEPNLLTGVEEDAITPTDYLFPEQWDHQIINTPDAWQFLRNMALARTFGSPEVIIAVVDSGIDPSHPDFAGTVSNGSSKIYRAFDFQNMVANNNSLGSGHGTSCASAAASRSNNPSAVAGAQEGVAGVAGNSRLLGIRRPNSGTDAEYADIYLWAAGFDPESDEDDFPDPIDPGADVISSSIGTNASMGSATSGTMAAVFDTLTDDGRDGRGVLLFFSAANNNRDNDVWFDRPWGMYSRCFSVAASTLANDGVTEVRANYSNFSSQTEFCAPSQDAFVGSSALHNPPANYGTFTATPVANPEGHGTVGRPTVQTTLSAGAAAGANQVTVASTAGLAVGQAIMLGAPGAGGTEAHLITAVNGGANQVTLNRNLFSNQPNGAPVSAAAPDYRSNFGGTSHATPICAGTGALMLSANPQLTWTQVRDLLRDTAVKINPGENNANGRWQDVNGNPSNSAAYNGNPFFSEFYGYGRIDTATAVREAGWDIDLITQTLNFNDVPEGHTVSRAIRFDVKSLWPTSFQLTPPGAPFDALSTTESLGSSTDSSVPREVYFWVTYTGTNAGDTITLADGITATVTNADTEQAWTIPVIANVVPEQTAAIELCLDRSASMDFPSGIGTASRIDVLRFSAGIMIDVLHEDNGLGIVGFDHDPHDVFDFRGPVGPPPSPTNPFDPDRTDMRTAINNFDPNPSGNTAIGDGIERALLRLDPVSGYDSKSIIVFTDGKETASKRVHEVEDLIDNRVFAIGLGKAENIEPATLNEVTASNDGYMLLADDLGTDSIFKLAKYFLQIQAAVNNQEIVVDPDGVIQQGQEHTIPFEVNEGDRTIEVIVMLPHVASTSVTLRTPNNEEVRPTDDGVVPGVTFGFGRNVVFYRLDLPLPIGAGEHAGTWTAVLRGRSLGHGGLTHGVGVATRRDADDAVAAPPALPYSVLVHTSSDLRMGLSVTQEHYEPGASIALTAALSQFGIPLESRCTVRAVVTGPTGLESSLRLHPTGGGAYEATFTATHAGAYGMLVRADGFSLRGAPFTREQVRHAFVWRGGNRPDPGQSDPGTTDPDRPDPWCEIAECLFNEKVLTPRARELAEKLGIDLDALADCLRARCDRQGGRAIATTLPTEPAVLTKLAALLDQR